MVTTCSRLWLSLLIMLVVCGLARIAQAQCDDQGWITTGSIPGAGPGPVNAMTWWDPDGDGPVTRKVVIAGDFTAIGNQPIDHIALYDPELDTWSQLGPPGAITGNVNAMVILPNNHILLGGQMTLGTTPVILAEWDGAAWGAFVDQNVLPGTFVTGSRVNKLVCQASGDIVVGGSFAFTGSPLGSTRVCRWDGTAWIYEGYPSRLAAGDPRAGTSRLSAIASSSNGDIYVGMLASNHAPSDCAYYHATVTVAAGADPTPAIGNIVTNCAYYSDTGVRSIVPQSDGSIIIAGAFLHSATPAPIGDYSWATLARVVGGTVTTLANNGSMEIPGSLNDGTLIVTRRPLFGGNSTLHLFNGSTLTPIGTPFFGAINSALELPNGDILLGGSFDISGATYAWNLARFRRIDNSWRPISDGTIGRVNTFTLAANGDLLIGGDFTTVNNCLSRGIVRQDRVSGTLTTLGGGIAPEFVRDYTSYIRPSVNAIAASADGRIYVGGDQHGAGGISYNGLSIWNGSSWTNTASIPPLPYWSVWPYTIITTQSLALTSQGLVVGCQTYNPLSNWGYPNALMLKNTNDWRMAACTNASGACSWQLGSPIVCISLPRDRLLFGGGFGIRIWNGTSWLPFSSGSPVIEDVRAAALLPDGSPIVIGRGTCNACASLRSIMCAWKLNGSAWQIYGDPVIFTPDSTNSNAPRSVAARPNGEVIVGGKGYLKRWNGTQWQPLANNIDGTVYSLQVLPDGDLAVGGDFGVIDGVVRPAFAIYRFGRGSCPADLGAQGGIPGNDGIVDNNDFFVFLNHFFDSDPRADLGSTGGIPGADGFFDNNDFVAFIDLFFAGC